MICYKYVSFNKKNVIMWWGCVGTCLAVALRIGLKIRLLNKALVFGLQHRIYFLLNKNALHNEI
jgi:hypothetical protein